MSDAPTDRPDLSGLLTPREAGLVDAALRFYRRHEEKRYAGLIDKFGEEVDLVILSEKREKLTLLSDLRRRVRP